jgi:hypothetical protein
MNIVPFEAAHLERLTMQGAQAYMSEILSEGYGVALEQGGPAFSGIEGETVIACLGVLPQWSGRAIAWGLVGVHAPDHMLRITRAVQAFLDTQAHRRIETTVATGFRQGARWAQMLGFEYEGTMPLYSPDGRSYDLYARYNP